MTLDCHAPLGGSRPAQRDHLRFRIERVNPLAMDIERKDLALKKKRKRIILSVLAVVLLAAAIFGVSQIEPASPTVERGSVWVDTVKRGPLLREVRGIGTLVPEDNRLITAVTIATVEKLVIYPGTAVEPDTIILAMSNPQLLQEAENARLEFTAQEAELRSLGIQHEGRLLEMESDLAELESFFKQAELEAEVNAELFEEGLVAELIFKQSQLNADQLEIRFALEICGASPSRGKHNRHRSIPSRP